MIVEAAASGRGAMARWRLPRPGSQEPRMMNEAPENELDVVDSAPNKRPWQFSLRSLFVLTTIFAVAGSFSTKFGPFVILLPLLLLPYWDIISEGRSSRESGQHQRGPTNGGPK